MFHVRLYSNSLSRRQPFAVSFEPQKELDLKFAMSCKYAVKVT